MNRSRLRSPPLFLHLLDTGEKNVPFKSTLFARGVSLDRRIVPMWCDLHLDGSVGCGVPRHAIIRDRAFCFCEQLQELCRGGAHTQKTQTQPRLCGGLPHPSGPRHTGDPFGTPLFILKRAGLGVGGQKLGLAAHNDRVGFAGALSEYHNLHSYKLD